jgi:hypothetical protein
MRTSGDNGVQTAGGSAPTINVTGLPTSLAKDAIVLLRRQGTELAIAEAKLLRLFTIDLQTGYAHAEHRCSIDLEDPIRALGDTAHGVLAACQAEEVTRMVLVEGNEQQLLIALPGTFCAMAAAGAEAVVATSSECEGGCRAYRIDVISGRVIAQQPLPSKDIDLNLDPSGRWISVADHPSGFVYTAPSTLAVDPRMYSPPQAAPTPAPTPAPHPVTCCCCVCQPPAPVGGPGGTGGAGTPPGTGTAGGPASQGGPQTGTAGIPTNNGGSVTGNGGRIDHHDGDGSKPPCSTDLPWPVTRFIGSAAYLIATDASYRRAAAMALNPVRVLAEYQFGRSGAVLAADRAAPFLLVHHRDSGTWDLSRIDLVEANLGTIIRQPSFGLEPDEGVVFTGTHVMSLMDGHAPGNGPIKILVLPIIEKTQTYSDPDVSRFAGYLRRTMVPVVRDYYNENSFGQLSSIDFSIFGDDAGPKGPPLALPRDHLVDYYFPAWDPAALILKKSAVSVLDQVVFDGREALKINAKPDGGLPAVDFDIPFAALVFAKDQDLFPVQVRFDAADRLTVSVTTLDGNDLDLDLQFTARSIDINQNDVAARLNDIATYLDGIFQDAEARAGLTSRLFAKPVLTQVRKVGLGFGTLVTRVSGAVNTGPKLIIRGFTASVIPADPLGMKDALGGTFNVVDTTHLAAYLSIMLRLAREAKNFDENGRRLDDASAAFDMVARTLTTTIPISTIVGGPAATVTLVSSSDLGSLFDSSSSKPNSATTFNNRQALRDRQQVYDDSFSAAVQRLKDAGRDPKAELAGFHVALIFPVEPAVNKSGDPGSVQPWETWNVSAPLRPFDLRGAENMTTARYSGDKTSQLQSVWALVFFGDGKPDNPLICHELGHGLGFRDLYFQTGYRDELAYLDDWALMSNHVPFSHHAGYHKWQVGWIPDSRVTTIPPTDPDVTTNTEVLLVPVELWDDRFVNDARAAFSAPPDMAVVQLIRLDLGGDGAVFDLVEARQRGNHFSQNLPSQPAVLITNALDPISQERYAFNGNFRRELQLLNPENILQNAGDTFDLAKAAELSAKGITVSVTDRKTVGAAAVFRIKITRTNSQFIDLYFSPGDPYYKSPDLYVDWAGDNPSRQNTDHDRYPLGQPTDQGDALRVPPSGTELHWLVARLRNRGQVEADQVKLQFKMCVPPGGGDRSKNFQLIGEIIVPTVAGGDVPVDGVGAWDLPAGFPGHTCLAVEIADYKIPQDSGGSALASDDVWVANNHAQKNVDKLVPLSGSPYDPIEFDYSVHNAAPRPEIAYLEPDGLPEGMTLTVTPARLQVGPGETVVFHCKLELDEHVIDAGCRSDRQFRITTWRQDLESTTQWGGVQYKVQPRKRVAVTLKGFWGYDNRVQLDGTVTPDPGGGLIRLRVAFEGKDAVWMPVSVGAKGVFVWTGTAPSPSQKLDSVADFEGNAVYGPARSAPYHLEPPPPIH